VESTTPLTLTEEETSIKKKLEEILNKSILDVSVEDMHTLHAHVSSFEKLGINDDYRKLVQCILKREEKVWAQKLINTISNDDENLKKILEENNTWEKVNEAINKEKDRAKIDHILRNPLHFSVSGVEFLDKHIQLLLNEEGKQGKEQEGRIHRFRELINYHCEIEQNSGRLSGVFSPRILFAVKFSNNLMGLLTSETVIKLEEFIDLETKKIINILDNKNDNADLSASGISRICTLYNYFAQKPELSNTCKLIIEILAKWQGNFYSKRKDDISNPDKFKTAEMLQVLEINKILKSSPDANQQNSHFINEINTHTKALAKKIAENLTNQDQHVDLLLTWDLILPFIEDNDIELEKKLIGEKIKHANAVRALAYFDKRKTKVFTKMEYDALLEIRSATWPNPEFKIDFFEWNWKRKPIEERLREIQDTEKPAIRQKLTDLGYNFDENKFAEKTPEGDQALKKAKALEKEVEELNKKWDDIATEQLIAEEDIKYFKEQPEVSDKLLKSHQAGLQKRITNHQLHSGDLEVLWDIQCCEDFITKDTPHSEETLTIFELRDKFKHVLTGLETVSFDEDNPEEWVKKIKEKVGAKSLLDYVKNNANNLLKNPQIQQEIVNGLTIHFREEIFDIIDGKLHAKTSTEDVAKKTEFWNQMRKHFSPGLPFFREEIAERYNKYAQLESDSARTAKAVNKKAKQALGIRVKSKEPLEGTNAKNMDAIGIWTDDIRDIDQMTAWLNNQTTHQQKKISYILSSLKESLSESDNQNFDTFKNNWTALYPKLVSQIAEIKEIYDLQFLNNDSGINFERLKEELFETKIEKTLEEIDSTIQSEETDSEEFQKSIVKNLDNLQNYLDFDSAGGFIQQEKTAWHNEFRQQPENLEYLRKLGVFDSANNTDQAEEKYEELRKDYTEKFDQYKKTITELENSITKDLERFDDDDFHTKYGVPKDYYTKLLADIKNYQGGFEEIWEKYSKPDFFPEWIKKYKEGDPRTVSCLIDEFSDWKNVTEAIEVIAKNTKDWKDWNEGNEKWNKENLSITGKIKKNKWTVKIYTLQSVWGMLKQSFEIWERRRKRKNEKNIGELGSKIFGEGTYGNEFLRMAQSSEEERIGEFEKAYANLEGWTIREKLYAAKNINDADEVRACINLLIKRGFLSWDDPELWKVFNRLYPGGKIFSIEEDVNLTDVELKSKLMKACKGIWPYSGDIFKIWDNDFKSGLNSAIDGFEKEFEELQMEGGREVLMTDMLQRWKRNDTKNVDPAKYECFLKKSFQQGRMNGQPDKRWYYLIMGITMKNTLGQTILSHSILKRFANDLLGEVPQMEFFSDTTGWKKNGKIVPKGTPGSHEGQWNYKDIMAWGKLIGTESDFKFKDAKSKQGTIKFFYHTMLASEHISGRAGRSQVGAKGKADADDGAMHAAVWDYRTVMQQIATDSTMVGKHPDDFWRRMLRGYDLYFRQMVIYLDDLDSQYKKAPSECKKGWKEMKDKTLINIGNRLKAGYAVSQVLSGNHKEGNQNVTVFEGNTWDRENPYSPKASESKEWIDDLMEKVTKDAGKENSELIDDFVKLKKKAGRIEEDSKPNQKIASKFFAEDELLFQNTDRIERNLRAYVAKRGGEKWEE